MEANFIPFILAKITLRKSNSRVYIKNLLKTDLCNATHLYLYLFPEIMEKLWLKINHECKKGARVVSCDFEFKDIAPDETIILENTKYQLGKKLYVYIVK